MTTQSIVLMGLKHSGKSSFGRQLADKLERDFFDLDDIVETSYRSDRLVSCREIYLRHGKEYFAELEGESAKILAEKLDQEAIVAALGGGTGENEVAMQAIVGHGVLVYINDSEDRLFERIMKRGRPAFLPEANPEVAFHELYQKRHLLYSRYADAIAQIDGARDEAYARLLTTIWEYRDAR